MVQGNYRGLQIAFRIELRNTDDAAIVGRRHRRDQEMATGARKTTGTLGGDAKRGMVTGKLKLLFGKGLSNLI